MLPIENATQLAWVNILRFTNATEVNDYTMKSGCCSSPLDLLRQLLLWSITDKLSDRDMSALGSITLCSYSCFLSSVSPRTPMPNCPWFYLLLALLNALLILRFVAGRGLLGTIRHVLGQCALWLYEYGAFTARRATRNTLQDNHQPTTSPEAHRDDHLIHDRDKVQQDLNTNERPRIRKTTVRRRLDVECTFEYE